MIIVMLLLSVIIPYFLEKRIYHPVSITWLSFFLPILIFRIELSLLFYVYSTFSFLVFIIGYYFVFHNVPKYHYDEISNSSGFNCVKIKFRLIFIVAFSVFLYNFSKVILAFGINAYTTISPKDIELTFGGSTVINYLFFINLIIPSISILLMHKFGVKKEWLIFLFVSLFSLGFTGIKSTLLFGLVISTFTYLNCKGKVQIGAFSIYTLVVFFIVLLMFFFVNLEGDIDALSYDKFSSLFFGYVGYNYLNLDLELNDRSSYEFGKYTFIFISKLIDPTLRGGYFASNDLLLIDKNYNMGTFLREYFVDFGFYGSLIVVFVLGAVGGFLARVKNVRDYFLIFYSIYLTACAFSFFGNQFIRLQFIYLAFASFFIIVFLKKVRFK